MLFKELLTDELNRQREEFRQFARSQAGDLEFYADELERFGAIDYAEIRRKLGEQYDCGALPSEELARARNFALGFDERWANHEEARRWAFAVLENRTTFAADGSQLFAEREVSLPVAAVQIGWFENPHNAAAGYEKNAKFFVLSPAELLSLDEPVIPETRVGQRRFEEEIAKAKEFLQRKAGWRERGERMPLAFYDGTLLLSIALPKTLLQTALIAQLVELARLSRDTRVPLIGYVDRSYARDLMAMLDAFAGRRGGTIKTLDDVSVLHAGGLRNWGDRTPFCYARRHGLEAFIDPRTNESLAGFVYLQTTSDNPPARLDIPSWIYEDGLLDEVVDTVRAECVIGLGYPYALETADQTAVITLRDREVFLQALQGFAKENNLNLRVSRKAASKGRRR
ncbi:MAG: DNA double-strand break repair nuclease NurA [Acidobacteria bacterium]|nr:DNA double-strand break repair nuclease NurA [Acidobacteriota bacterium]